MDSGLGGLISRGRMAVGGLDCEVESDRPFYLEGGDAAYAEFFQPAVSAEPLTGVSPLCVRLSSSPPPSLAGAATIFNAPPLYRTYQTGSRRVITCDYPTVSPPHQWTTHIDPVEGCATVHYQPVCLQTLTNGSHVLRSPFRHPLDQMVAILMLAVRKGLVLHSCGFESAGRGIVLAGRSGAGKTTSARVLEPRGDVTVLSDDRTIVRCHEDGWRVHGTPWPGDARIARNRSAPLSALVFLTQADHNAIAPLAPAEVLRRLLIVASVPWYDAEYMPPVLDTIDRLLADVPSYEFRFRNDPSAADTVVDFTRSLV